MKNKLQKLDAKMCLSFSMINHAEVILKARVEPILQYGVLLYGNCSRR